MPKSNYQRAMSEVDRAEAAGRITAEQARTRRAWLRQQEHQRLYRAALDAHQGAGSPRPVEVRLIGDRADVAALLLVLEQVVTLTDVSEPMAARTGDVRVYATAARRHPLTGGER